MKTTLVVVCPGLLTMAYASSTHVHIRDCKPGKLICHDESQYGICGIDNTVSFMNTAEGTRCVCAGTECSITFTAGTDTEAPALPSSQQESDLGAPSQTGQRTWLRSSSQQFDPRPTTSDPAGISKDSPVSASVATPQPLSSTDMTAPSSTSSKSVSGSDTNTAKEAGNGDYIKTFLGNGEPASGWPAQWISFDSMWANNLDTVISQSCAAFGQADNSASESADIKSAIEEVAQSSGVDRRFILAIALQESNCCVRTPTTNYGVNNPGIMQSHDGAHSCYNIERCPKESIQGMIADGVTGTPSGDGLAQILEKIGGSDVSRYYKAARKYNSGSIDPSGLLEKGGSTHCYASDIANRLTGWSRGLTGCKIS